MAEIYDSIADGYQTFYDLPAPKHIELHTFTEILGDVTGQSVLDLACGEGVYTRLVMSLGASGALGLDISPEMIRLAQAGEQAEPTGAHYRVGDARTAGRIGSFDLVTACFLLNYASTRSELLAMCRTIAGNLRPGGRFVGLNNNLAADPDHYDAGTKYGFSLSAPRPLTEGDTMTVTLHLPGPGHPTVQFPNYYLSRATYESVVAEVGLVDLAWHSPTVSDDGHREFGAEFWADALAHPYFMGLTARKPAD